jgi:hypothetical protein
LRWALGERLWPGRKLHSYWRGVNLLHTSWSKLFSTATLPGAEAHCHLELLCLKPSSCKGILTCRSHSFRELQESLTHLFQLLLGARCSRRPTCVLIIHCLSLESLYQLLLSILLLLLATVWLQEQVLQGAAALYPGLNGGMAGLENHTRIGVMFGKYTAGSHATT